MLVWGFMKSAQVVEGGFSARGNPHLDWKLWHSNVLTTQAWYAVRTECLNSLLPVVCLLHTPGSSNLTGHAICASLIRGTWWLNNDNQPPRPLTIEEVTEKAVCIALEFWLVSRFFYHWFANSWKVNQEFFNLSCFTWLTFAWDIRSLFCKTYEYHLICNKPLYGEL